MKIGDKVRNIRTGKIGVVIRIFKSGCIAVLESMSPATVICTHYVHMIMKSPWN